MFACRSVPRLTTLGALFAAAALLGPALPANARELVGIAGPPWISIETPVNPYDATTRGAFLVVHAYHHGTPLSAPVSGVAEGIVNGERRTVQLEFTPTSRTGAYALRKLWGNAGVWTLVITVSQGPGDVAQALVDVDTDGQVARVQVPTKPGEGNYLLPRKVSTQEVDAALRERAKVAVAQRGR